MIFNIMGGKEGWHVKDLLRAAQSLGVKAHVTDFRLISHSLAQPSNQAFEEADCTIIRTMPPGSLEQVVFRMDLSSFKKQETHGTQSMGFYFPPTTTTFT